MNQPNSREWYMELEQAEAQQRQAIEAIRASLTEAYAAFQVDGKRR